MYEPTQADLDARERARTAGRALAAQAHAPTAEDQPPADEAPLATRMEVLRLEPDEAPAPAPVVEVVAAPVEAPAAAAPHAMKPQPGGLPTAVWLVKLAEYHAALRVGPRSAEGDLPDGVQRVTWNANGVEASADFASNTAARLFIVEAADEGVTTALWFKVTPAPESASPAAETGTGGTTAPETDESAPAAEKTAFRRFGSLDAITPAVELAQAFGAFRAGDNFAAPPRGEESTVRVTWKGDTLPVTTFADFATFEGADVFADMLLDEDFAGSVALSGGGEPPQPKAKATGPLSAFLNLDLDGLLRQALLAELKASSRRVNVVRWWAIAGWLTALVFGAAAVSMAVALRGFLA